jgi:hypothetical protein
MWYRINSLFPAPHKANVHLPGNIVSIVPNKKLEITNFVKRQKFFEMTTLNQNFFVLDDSE